jgi:hypothetical protein
VEAWDPLTHHHLERTQRYGTLCSSLEASMRDLLASLHHGSQAAVPTTSGSSG